MQEECNEKRAIISKDTLIPIGFVITLMSASWFISNLNARLNQVESKTLDVPSRAEFQALQTDVSEIKQDVKTLIKDSN